MDKRYSGYVPPEVRTRSQSCYRQLYEQRRLDKKLARQAEQEKQASGEHKPEDSVVI